MEAFRVQRAEHGGQSALLTRAESPIGGASSKRPGARTLRVDPRCTPLTEPAELPDTAGPSASAGFLGPSGRLGAAEAPGSCLPSAAGLPDAAGLADASALAEAIAVVKAAVAAGPDFLAMAGYAEAADYASQVEDLSRSVEYLQVLGAGAVDRTRAQAITDAAAARTRTGRTWITGWDNGTETLNETDASWPHGSADPAAVGDTGFAGSTTPVYAGFTGPAVVSVAPAPAASGRAVSSVPASPADDGCRNTAEFLRARLRISSAEAHRRITLAHTVLPRPGITGHTQPAERPELATALAAGIVASRPATIITLALDRVRHHATEDTTARMEHALTRTAAENDTDFLTSIARRWTDAIDQDGTEPTEHELHHRQGAFLRQRRRGLHHLEIFATPDQYEHLLTVMNTATNPRTHPTTEAGNTDTTGASDTSGSDTGSTPDGRTTHDTGSAPDNDLDRRTRPQQLLDGLVGDCKAALASGTLPAAGGLRPQVMVTITRTPLPLPNNRHHHQPRRRDPRPSQ